MSDKLQAVRSEARAAAEPIPARLAPDAPLFNVPAGLVRALDLDLLAAGIAQRVKRDGKWIIDKRDDRGRTLDVHALRHTFATMLSAGKVAPRTAQAAMRHSTLELTMGTYTDPKLLDVAGALDVLPTLPLDDDPDRRAERATGTEGGADTPQALSLLVPVLVPTSDKRCISETIGGKPSAQRTSGVAALSDVMDNGNKRLANDDKQRATRLERATSSLEGWKPII